MSNIADIIIIDYHCGNLKSVEQAFTHCGATVMVSSDPEIIATAKKLVLPGVGAFPVGMSNLHALNLVDPILKRVEQGTPLLGICLGMQLLLNHSEEYGGANGLGLIKGNVRKISSSNPRVKLPHIGWNKLNLEKTDQLLQGNDYFYFVHSYQALPEDHADILASSAYEDVTFCAAISKDNVWGMQFHPENSSHAGLDILQRFIAI